MAHFSAAVASPTQVPGARRARQFFYIDLPVLWDLETDGLAAAIRNDRSPPTEILKNKQIPGCPFGHVNWSRFNRSNRLRA